MVIFEVSMQSNKQKLPSFSNFKGMKKPGTVVELGDVNGRVQGCPNDCSDGRDYEGTVPPRINQIQPFVSASDGAIISPRSVGHTPESPRVRRGRRYEKTSPPLSAPMANVSESKRTCKEVSQEESVSDENKEAVRPTSKCNSNKKQSSAGGKKRLSLSVKESTSPKASSLSSSSQDSTSSEEVISPRRRGSPTRNSEKKGDVSLTKEKSKSTTMKSEPEELPHACHCHNFDDFLKNEGPFMEVDARDLVKKFNKAFTKVSKRLQKPNVLITGITGAGKSSLVNAIFGRNIAETGTGVPVTQHFTKYESNDMRVVIYDSKGLEHGQFDKFLQTTNDFFDSFKGGSDPDAIHAIWYIVNSAHSRWEPFEERICKELLNKAPLMFVLNKADISVPSDRNKIKSIIKDMELPNCVGVFETVAQPNSKLKNIETCPNCGSDDLVIKTKGATMICGECNHTECLTQQNGLAELIGRTCEVLPQVLRGAFISAQNVNFQLKEQHSFEILEEYWTLLSQVRTQAKLLRIITKMMAKLSIIWDFKRGHEYGEFMAKDLVGGFTWKDKFQLLFQSKNEVQRVHTTALGILWNRCLHDLAMEVFKVWSRNSSVLNRSPSVSKNGSLPPVTPANNRRESNSKTKHNTPSSSSPVLSLSPSTSTSSSKSSQIRTPRRPQTEPQLPPTSIQQRSSEFESSCSEVFKKTFSQMNERNLVSIEESIIRNGFKLVLQEELKNLEAFDMSMFGKI